MLAVQLVVRKHNRHRFSKNILNYCLISTVENFLFRFVANGKKMRPKYVTDLSVKNCGSALLQKVAQFVQYVRSFLSLSLHLSLYFSLSFFLPISPSRSPYRSLSLSLSLLQRYHQGKKDLLQ